MFLILSRFPSFQIIQEVETLADTTNEHPLALLAEQTKKLLKKDTSMYLPILSLRHRNASAVSASLIHKLYGIKLVSLHLDISSPY